MKNLNLIAFDLGASNGRAIIGEYDGERIRIRELHKFPNGALELCGHLHWNLLGLFQEIKTGLRKAVVEVDGEPDSLGVDTWGVDYGLLDGDDRLMANPYAYRDQRTDGLLEEVEEQLGREEIYSRTGIQFMQINTLYQLYAEKKYRPWILENAETLLFMPDLMNFFLTGEKCNEYTIASTSQIYDPEGDRWANTMLAELGIPAKIMQPLVYPGTSIGPLLSSIAQDVGLAGGMEVMAVGSHDTASAVLATPLRDRETSIYISSGTWSLLGMELDEPLINEDSLRENFTNECGVGKKVRFLKNISGLWLIQECKRSWERDGLELSYEEISRRAAAAEPNKFRVDPDDPRFLNPDDMPEAIRNYCRDTNQPLPADPGEMARGIYESLAHSYQEVITRLEGVTGQKIRTIHMVGGGIQAELLCQFTADITKRPVITGPVEATALGNILAQLMAHGEISGLKEAREIVEESIDLREYLPGKGEFKE